MEFLMLVIIGVCIALLLIKRDKPLPLILGVLSIDVIATFAVLLFSNGSAFALVLFIGNLLVTPWIAFRQVARNVPQKDQ